MENIYRNDIKYIYSVLTVITKGYERLREVPVPNPYVEYVCVTDDKDLKSDTWKIIYRENIWFLYVKHHQYEFVSTDVCVWLDGSYKINDDFSSELIYPFINSDKEMMISIHNRRTNMYDELVQWWVERGIPTGNVYELAKLLNQNNCTGHDCLFQTSCMITKNTENVKRIFEKICEYETQCSVVEPYRDDQVIFSMVIHTFFKDWDKLVLMNFESTSDNKFLTWCIHKTDTLCPANKQEKFRCFDKEQHLYKIGNPFD